jgi:signal peptidase I
MVIGVYKITRNNKDKFQKNDIVLFEAPITENKFKSKNLFMKPVVATKGDIVDVSDDYLKINDQIIVNFSNQKSDSKNYQKYQPYPNGTYYVKDDELWLIATKHQKSHDSRYFGPVKISKIKSQITPVWLWN